MIGRSPRCYIPSFIEIGSPVLGKKILMGFTINTHGGHLGHVTSNMLANFHVLVPKSVHAKFG